MDELLRDKLNDDLINDTFGVSTKGVLQSFLYFYPLGKEEI